MTCRELQDYWGSGLNGTFPVGPDSFELAEHAAICPECNRFVEERKELAKLLQLVRDSSPAVPESLDCVVLEGYRRYLRSQHRTVVSAQSTNRLRLRGVLGWAAAAVFACAVAYGAGLLLIQRQHRSVGRNTAGQQSVLTPQMAPEPEIAAAKQPARKPPRSVTASAKYTKHPLPAAEQDTSPPTIFESLMYCDQLSCPSTMDVIRLQLPSPLSGVTPASMRANGVVFAEVLVGPDGIARGVRVLE